MKLIPPRPTFARDMTAEERAVMQQHVPYVGEAFKQGSVLIYGPGAGSRRSVWYDPTRNG
ncbi:MAG: hypothetical protein WA197_02750 [Candidatus Acidiferrales bacterium]